MHFSFLVWMRKQFEASNWLHFSIWIKKYRFNQAIGIVFANVLVKVKFIYHLNAAVFGCLLHHVGLHFFYRYLNNTIQSCKLFVRFTSWNFKRHIYHLDWRIFLNRLPKKHSVDWSVKIKSKNIVANTQDIFIFCLHIQFRSVYKWWNAYAFKQFRGDVLLLKNIVNSWN